jgi:hypothetical protein
MPSRQAGDPRDQLLATVESDGVRAVAFAEHDRAAGHRDLHAELLGLKPRPFGELRAGVSRREAQVVSIRPEVAAWPPTATASIRIVDRPPTAP